MTLSLAIATYLPYHDNCLILLEVVVQLHFSSCQRNRNYNRNNPHHKTKLDNRHAHKPTHELEAACGD
jgi:hypothetical protein